MIYRKDNNIIEALVSIYTSNLIRDIPYRGQIKFEDRNIFLKDLIQGDKKSIISMHVPEIDYETTIVVDNNKYIFDHLQENNKKLILFNVVEVDSKEYVVGERRRFY